MEAKEDGTPSLTGGFNVEWPLPPIAQPPVTSTAIVPYTIDDCKYRVVRELALRDTDGFIISDTNYIES